MKTQVTFFYCEIFDFRPSRWQCHWCPGTTLADFHLLPSHMPPHWPATTWRSTFCCQPNTPTSPTAEQRLTPTALINRTGCGLLSQSHQSPPPCRRARLSSGYTSFSLRCNPHTKIPALHKGIHFHWPLLLLGHCDGLSHIFRKHKLILVTAGLTLAFSD